MKKTPSAFFQLQALEKDAVIRRNFPKLCGNCKRVHTAESWQSLANPRPWKLPWGEEQELRECVCRSTLAIVVVGGEVDEDLGEWRSTLPVKELPTLSGTKTTQDPAAILSYVKALEIETRANIDRALREVHFSGDAEIGPQVDAHAERAERAFSRALNLAHKGTKKALTEAVNIAEATRDAASELASDLGCDP